MCIRDSAYNFWTPFILVPLVAGIIGYVKPTQVFWVSSIAGILAVFVMNQFSSASTSTFDGTLVGIVVNALIFFTYRPKKQLVGI
jgi:uncharacterized membrane protein